VGVGVRKQKAVILTFIGCALLAPLLYFLCGRDFTARWNKLGDGLTEIQVIAALGYPRCTNTPGTLGAEKLPTVRWEYKHWQSVYCVDFDHIGPKGTLVVYRKDSYLEEWKWLEYVPWRHAKARG
jgi:hypothetical protein